MNWYVSRYVPIDADTYMVIEGIDPWNEQALEHGPLGEHARWWLRLRQKHERWPWWRLEPPPITGVRLIHVTDLDRLLGLLLAWWITWRLARP